MPAVSLVKWPLFVTFTAKNYPDAKSVRDVRRAFTALRRHRWWKQKVAGGVAHLEITNRGKGWHPHVHALLDCRWLSVTQPPPRIGQSAKDCGSIACREVADVWSDCLKRKGSVKVRRVWARDDGSLEPALREVLKYSVKPDELTQMRGSQIVDVIDAIDRTRLLVTWGTLYRRPELKREKRPLACECGQIGYFVPEKFV
jgi:hypothetical protein